MRAPLRSNWIFAPFYLAAIAYFLFGWRHFGQQPLLSAQDDLNLLNPHTFEAGFWKSLWDYYVVSSGRLGEFGTFIAWNRIGSALYQGDIFHYPWWLFKCIACLTYGLAAVNFGRVVSRVGRLDQPVAASLVALSFTALIGLNPIVVRSLLEIGTLWAAYAFGMLTLSCLAIAVTSDRAGRPPGLVRTALIVAGYAYCMVVHEQVFLSTAVLGFSWVLHDYLFGRREFRRTLQLLSAWVALHLGGGLIILLSPGEHSKIRIAGGLEASPIRWVQQLSLAFSELLPFPVAVSKLGFFAACALAVFWMVEVLRKRGLSGLRDALSTPRGQRVYWALAFFTAGSMACATAIASKYFPERARLTPMLSFGGSAVLFGALALEWLAEAVPPRLRTLGAALLALALASTGWNSLGNALPVWAGIANIDGMRHRTYRDLEARIRANPAAPQHVALCPPDFDAFWGFNSLISWQKLPREARVRVDGVALDEAREARLDGAPALRSVCSLSLPRYVPTPEPDQEILPVLKLLGQDSSRGLKDPGRPDIVSFFPIRGDFRSCRGVLSLHDSIRADGHQLVNRIFELALDRTVKDGLSTYSVHSVTPVPGLRFEMVDADGRSGAFVAPEIDRPSFIKSVRRSSDLGGFLRVEASSMDPGAMSEYFDIRIKCGI